MKKLLLIIFSVLFSLPVVWAQAVSQGEVRQNAPYFQTPGEIRDGELYNNSGLVKEAAGSAVQSEAAVHSERSYPGRHGSYGGSFSGAGGGDSYGGSFYGPELSYGK